MPTTVESCHNGRILRIILMDPCEQADVLSMAAAIHANLNNARCPVHRLIDIRGLRGVPLGLLSALQDALAHPNNSEIALVGGTQVIQSFIQLAFRLAHFYRVELFETEDAARICLQDIIDSECDDAKPVPELVASGLWSK